jgi:hypothetical protein
LGKLSEVETWSSVILRLQTSGGVRWLTVGDRFAPFGYLPAELRGQPAIRLVDGTPKDRTATQGAADGVVFEGHAKVSDDGSAQVEIVESYTGKMAISMRNVFDRVAPARQRELVEARLLGRSFPGARLRSYEIGNAADLDKPLSVHMKAEVALMLRSEGATATMRAPFPLRQRRCSSAALPTSKCGSIWTCPRASDPSPCASAKRGMASASSP